jgi:hypothetical protein
VERPVSGMHAVGRIGGVDQAFRQIVTAHPRSLRSAS